MPTRLSPASWTGVSITIKRPSRPRVGARCSRSSIELKQFATNALETFVFRRLRGQVTMFWQLQHTIPKHFGNDQLQVKNARRGLIHSHAGTGTYVTVTILERPN